MSGPDLSRLREHWQGLADTGTGLGYIAPDVVLALLEALEAERADKERLPDVETLAVAMWEAAPGRHRTGPADRGRSAEYRRWAERTVVRLRDTAP